MELMQGAMSNNTFAEKRFELMIDMNNKKIAAEMAKMSEAISKLNSDIADLRRSLINNRPQPIQQSAPTFTEQPTVVRHEEPAQVKNDQGVVRPRYGDYKSEDVSIGKFFYFGSKK